jgi:hypothetical protein
MSALKHHYLPHQTALPSEGSSIQLTRETSATHGPALRYSSPWPWVLALMISCAMWATIGWLVWNFI